MVSNGRIFGNDCITQILGKINTQQDLYKHGGMLVWLHRDKYGAVPVWLHTETNMRPCLYCHTQIQTVRN